MHVEDDFEFIPDTPDDVVQMMCDQDFWSSTEIDIMQPILDKLLPDRVDEISEST